MLLIGLTRSHSRNKTPGQLSGSGSGSDVASSSGSEVTFIQKKADVGCASSSTMKVDKQVVNVSKSLHKTDGTSSKGKTMKNVASVGDTNVTPKKKTEKLRKEFSIQKIEVAIPVQFGMLVLFDQH